jgi:L-ribulose-5-phosphate 4-epimerase
MSYDELKRQAFEANMELNRRGLVLYTWGNVSQIDRGRGVFAIKPSGVPYDKLAAADMVVVDMDNRTVEGKLKPSSDTRTHGDGGWAVVTAAVKTGAETLLRFLRCRCWCC